MVNVNNEWHQMLNLSSAALVLDFCWERIQSQGTQIQEKVYLEGHRGRRNKLQRQNKDPWNLGVRKAKKSLPGGKGIGEMHVYSRESAWAKKEVGKDAGCAQEREHKLGPSTWGLLSAFQKKRTLREVQGEDVNRTQSYPSTQWLQNLSNLVLISFWWEKMFQHSAPACHWSHLLELV